MHFSFNGFKEEHYLVRCSDTRLDVECITIHADDISGYLVITGDVYLRDGGKIPKDLLEDEIAPVDVSVATNGKTIEVFGLKFLTNRGEYLAKRIIF
jgi:hypothetical protein